MYKNEITEATIVDLLEMLRKGARFVSYQDERLFNRAVEQAETLHLMIIGLAALDYVDPEMGLDPNSPGFQMSRQSVMPWFLPSVED